MPLAADTSETLRLRDVYHLDRCQLRPFAHQVEGIHHVVTHPFSALFDEMGVGKTLQTIVAMQLLFHAGKIKRVIVLCPAAVRDVWFNPELGELKKHLWSDTHVKVTEYHAKSRHWSSGPEHQDALEFIITNYDFIRNSTRLGKLLAYADNETFLVCDESSAVKTHTAVQTKATLKLRKRCYGVVLLNGTPIAHSPMDMYAQGQIMDPRILDCDSYYHFRSRYAVMGASQGFPKIIGWQSLDDLQRRFKPFVMRRLKTECLDLPPKLDPVIITVPLESEEWHLYKEMRDEMVAWLDEQTVSVAPQAVVKAIRLAQITSGFLGGIQEEEPEDPTSYREAVNQLVKDGLPVHDLQATRPAWLPPAKPLAGPGLPLGDPKVNPRDIPYPGQPAGHQGDRGTITREVGRSKFVAFLQRFDQELDQDPNLKLLVWCKFRPELQRLANYLEVHYRKRGVQVGRITGGQKREEREAALRLLDPRTMPAGPAVVVGSQAAGGMGLNLAGAHLVIYVSNDYSLKTRLQSEDRVHRPGQTYPVSYLELVACGPQGQKTIDHIIMKSLREKNDVATWTTAAWRKAITEE